MGKDGVVTSKPRTPTYMTMLTIRSSHIQVIESYRRVARRWRSALCVNHHRRISHQEGQDIVLMLYLHWVLSTYHQVL